ncbi:MAG: hypothetical protein PHY64_01230 [Eubacteriales bacterium]|nr:hypothetical protein [Eubacteriales bacterium]
MRKQLIKASLIGALGGIAIMHVAALALSYQLRLGYFLPYPAFLPEWAGGEMNAVLLQTLVCALLGAGVGVALKLLRQRPWRLGKRALGAAASVALSMLTSFGVVLLMVR